MDQQLSKNRKFAKNLGSVNFFCLGVTSLISWNAILTALDFFNDKFPVNVYFILQLPYQICGTVCCLLMYFAAKKISIFWRITGGGIILAITTVASAVVITFFSTLSKITFQEAEVLPSNAGFWICMAIIGVLGIGNISMQSSSIAFATLFPKDNFMSMFWTGSGFSGVLIGLLRMLFLTVFGDTEKGTNAGTICFFSVAGGWILLSLLLNMYFMRQYYCQWALRQAGALSVKRGQSFFGSLWEDEKQMVNQEEEEKSQNDKKGLAFYWEVCKKIQPHMILVWLLYVQTFMLFTGISIEKLNIPQISDSWKLVTLALIYNCYDMTGKYFTNLSQGSDKIAYIAVGCRFIFYVLDFLLIETHIPFLASKWWAYIVMLFFALSNGYCTAIMMIQGPSKVSGEEKETAGFLMTFGLMFGILSGALISQGFTNISTNN